MHAPETPDPVGAPENDRSSKTDAAAQVARGFVMGAADVVPGVSGGTVALVLGIYERLVANIHRGAEALGRLVRFDARGSLERLRAVEWGFLIPLLAGIGLAVLSLARLISTGLEDHPVPMSALFFGLISASAIIAWRMIDEPDGKRLTILVVVAVLAFFMLGIGTGERSEASLLLVLVSGALAICAMILPGVSGSFLLLTIGMYELIIDAVNDRDLVGSLLTNPGGPGGSGIEYLGASPFSSGLSERFDLVSWDPRGVGASTSFTCGDSAGDFLSLDPGPDDPDELSAIEQAADAVARECESDDGYLLAHVNTEEVARDLEAIRLALGDEPLNYLGFSYGTHIGQLYAEMFGNHVRSMVLDGVVDPALGFEDFLLGQTAAFETAFETNVSGCAEAGEATCGVEDLAAAYDKVAATVEVDPLPGGPNVIGPAEVATAATFAAYRSDGWTVLGPALADALDGDGDALWDLAENYYEFGGYGSYAAVVCTDTEHPADTDAYREFYDRAVAVSARFGPSVANEMLPCATWGVDPQDTARPITAPDAPPILVVGNTGDPATPLANAQAVAGSLVSGHLVVVDSEGHTAYGTNRCLRAIADDYLIDLTLPPTGTSC